jgi:nucleotide-binding universal stress UspA family protein
MQNADLLSETPQSSSVTPDLLIVRNILLATDFSEFSERALAYAVGIARRYESQLFLFHCINPIPYNLVEPDAVQVTCDDVQDKLERLASDLRRQNNVEVKVVVATGDLAMILPRAVQDLDLDLIVAGTHGRKAGKEWPWDRLPRSLWTKPRARFLAWGLSLIGHEYENSGQKTFCWLAIALPAPHLRSRMPIRLPANMAPGSLWSMCLKTDRDVFLHKYPNSNGASLSCGKLFSAGH